MTSPYGVVFFQSLGTSFAYYPQQTTATMITVFFFSDRIPPVPAMIAARDPPQC